jgi:carboxylesterase type B
MLSTLAKEHSHPIVLVQIQYRLGAFGFVASSDLASEYSSTTPTDQDNYFANFGLIDQRNAFEWVQNHIQVFWRRSI